ncbi:MAG: DedA family protein [Bdellovibrionales bacterium]
MENSGLSYTILAFFAGLTGWKAYALILGVLLICGFGVPIPEDITLVGAGILAGTGKISIFGAYAAGFIGVLAGDFTMYTIGRKYGRAVFEWRIFKRIFTPKIIKKAEERIQKNGKFVCFMARFLPGLRSPIYLSCGILGVKPTTLLLMDGLAALVSVPVWIELGRYAGNNPDFIIEKAKEFHIYIIVGILALVAVKLFMNRRKKRLEELEDSLESNAKETGTQ